VNLTYGLWILYTNVSGLTMLLFASLLLPHASEGFLLAAINFNQLFVFLIVRLSEFVVERHAFESFDSTFSLLYFCSLT
jgi:hypothetical protein